MGIDLGDMIDFEIHSIVKKIEKNTKLVLNEKKKMSKKKTPPKPAPAPSPITWVHEGPMRNIYRYGDGDAPFIPRPGSLTAFSLPSRGQR